MKQILLIRFPFHATYVLKIATYVFTKPEGRYYLYFNNLNLRIMKKILLGLGTLLILNMNSVGQLSGTYHIPDYTGPGFPSVYNAVLALNSQGISGNVTFLVAAGFNESTEIPIILTATGYPGSEIVFQKNGIGPNPKITRGDGGSLSTTLLGAQGDAVIIIEGSDYVTFNGIDVAATNSGIEYGYYLRKASGTDGCKHVAIANSSITMTKATSVFVTGIYCSNNTASSPTNSNTGVTVTSTGGRHEYVKIVGNTIQNVFWGISVRGYNHTTPPYDLYDQDFDIGAMDYGNTILNYAGYSTTAAYGIHAIYHDNLNINHNTINNTAGGGTPFSWLGVGIYHASSTDAVGAYCHNNIQLTSTSQVIYGIHYGNSGTSEHFINNNVINLSTTSNAPATHIINSTSVGSATINYNSFSYGDFASTSASYLISCGYNINNLTCIGNYTNGVINKTGEGPFYGIRFAALSSSAGTCQIHDNNIQNIILTGASDFFGIFFTASVHQTTFLVTGNTISNITGDTGDMYGVYSGDVQSGSQVMYNTVSDITNSGSGFFRGYRIGAPVSGTLHLGGNIANNLTNAGSGSLYGMLQISSANGITHTFNNQVFD
jgi:trimeric autotransporter adhesin